MSFVLIKIGDIMNFKNKNPFRLQNFKGEKPKIDSFTIWLNEDERKELEYSKGILQQPKDSTALKQLAHIGYLKLIGDVSFRWSLGQVSRNVYNNKKIGIPMNLENPAVSNGKAPENLPD
jgi:hypothetical protein